MNWATPRWEVESKGAWFQIIDQFWSKQKPKIVDQFSPLFPRVAPNWTIDRKRPGTSGTVQAALTRLETHLGFPPLCTLRSPRNWFPTMGTQLMFSEEKRNWLGRWKQGSKMPNRYDRAHCVTELRVRGDIFSNLRLGWTPSNAFEIPSKGIETNENKGMNPRFQL